MAYANRLYVCWEPIPPFKDSSISGARFEGDPHASGPPDNWERIGIVGTRCLTYARMLAQGGTAAVAYSDPGENWHAGILPPGKEFSSHSMGGEALLAAGFRIGENAVKFSFGVLLNYQFSPAPTIKIASTTAKTMQRNPLVAHIAII